MKKVIFVAINSSWSQSNLAFYYLREMIRDLAYSTAIVDFTLSEPMLQIMEGIYQMQADVLCFSVYIWNRTFLAMMLPQLRKILPQCTFVLGGPEVMNMPEIANSFRIVGAGESAFYQLAQQDFSHAEAILQLPNLTLSELPFPYREEDAKVLQDHLVYYETFRGCPYRCVYCLSANDQRNELRFNVKDQRDKAKLISELDALLALKPRTIKFIDRSFNIFKEHAHTIWNYAIQSDASCDFHFEIYPDLLSEDDIVLLENAPANRIRFEIGIQTVDKEIAKASGRNSDWQHAKTMINDLKQRTKVRIHADLLVGLPGENYASIIHSLNELCATEPAAVQLGMLKILPDTPMQPIALERGYSYLDVPPYQVLSTDALSYQELCEIDDMAHILSLYWNKEEHCELWHELLKGFSAIEIIRQILAIHHSKNMPLHSVAKANRTAVMQEIASIHHLY